MGRKKGDGRGRLGGRAQGTPNKITGSIKEWLRNVVNSNRQQMEKDMKELKPRERLQVLEKLLPYIVARASEPTAHRQPEHWEPGGDGNYSGMAISLVDIDGDGIAGLLREKVWIDTKGRPRQGIKGEPMIGFEIPDNYNVRYWDLYPEYGKSADGANVEPCVAGDEGGIYLEEDGVEDLWAD